MKAMILAAGRGERMRPLTDTLPKPLLTLAGRTLIEHLIQRLASAGVRDLVINLGYRGAQIRERLGTGAALDVRIEYSDEGEPPLETGGGIFRALPLLGPGPFVLANADVWSELDFRILASRALPASDLAHLVLVANPAHRPGGDFALIDGRVCNDGAPRLTYSGLSLLRPELFGDCTDGRFPLAPLLRSAAARGQLGGERFDGRWSDVGTPQRLLELQAPR